MISNVVDYTTDFNNQVASGFNLDVSDWDYVVVQMILTAGTITFSSTNDSGAVTGGTDGSPSSAQNWVAVLGTNLNTGTTATSTAASNSLFKFNIIGRYLQLSGAAGAATKVLIYYAKIK